MELANRLRLLSPPSEALNIRINGIRLDLAGVGKQCKAAPLRLDSPIGTSTARNALRSTEACHG